jgi:hypothetical protein
VHSLPPDSSQKRSVFVEDDVEQQTVNFQPTVIINEAQLSEPIHKEANPSSGCTDHFRQRFLAYLGTTFSDFPSFPMRASNKSVRANRFSAELKSWSTKSACVRL